MYQKSLSYDIWFWLLYYKLRSLLRYKVRQTESFVTLPFHPPNNLKNQNFEKMKKTWRYCFTHVYHKWQSYDVWFLRYGAQETEFFVIWGHFLPFYPNNNRVRQLTYITYIRMPNYVGIHMILDMHTLTSMLTFPRIIFKIFKKNLVLMLYCLKPTAIYLTFICLYL